MLRPLRMPAGMSYSLCPVDPYGATKVAVEAVNGNVCGAGAPFAATCFRDFNAAGAHPDAEVGERYRPEMHHEG